MTERRKPEEPRRGSRKGRGKVVIMTKKDGVTIIAEGTPAAFKRMAERDRR